MTHIAIIADGEMPRKPYPRYLIESADAVICCDRAAARFERIFGKMPDYVIGDMDSLPARLRKHYGERLIHITEQDHNDMTKAVRLALEKFCGFSFDSGFKVAQVPATCEDTYIHILGASGKREDHTIGNYSLLMEYERMFELSKRGISAEIVSDWTSAFVMTDSGSFDCGEGRRVSIFSPDNGLHLVSEGLEWPTDGVVFDNWWKATLNRATADSVKLSFSHPSLVLVILG